MAVSSGLQGGDCVYIESRRPNTPYFICSIQDFKLVSSFFHLVLFMSLYPHTEGLRFSTASTHPSRVTSWKTNHTFTREQRY
ncbi:hypothetical protein PAMP_011920 [Pampus punctatissimus]